MVSCHSALVRAEMSCQPKVLDLRPKSDGDLAANDDRVGDSATYLGL